MRTIFLLTIFLFSLSSCKKTNNNYIRDVNNQKDDLIGEYSIKENSEIFIKIYKEGDNYFSIIKENSWSKPLLLNNANDEVLIHLFGDNWKSFVKFGLTNPEGFGIFKIEKGATYNGKKYETGYFFYLSFIGGDIYKH